MRYAVAYIKVKENKEGILEFEGPVVGPVVPTEQEAHERARAIVAASRNAAIMPKIYKVEDNFSIEDILETCTDHFARMRKNIEESKEITDKPIRRSK